MSYRTLEAWQEARALAKEIYEVTRGFPGDELFGLTTQVRRAAVSVVSNIAEGNGRWSLKEQCIFYYVARGSLMEVETQIILATDFEYIGAAKNVALLKRTVAVARKLNALINSNLKRVKKPRAASSEP